MLSGGLAANRVMEVRRRNFLEHDFTPGFRVELHHKDLGIALRAARELRRRAAGHGARRTRCSRRCAPRATATRDHSALLTHIEDLAQHTIGALPERD